MKLVSPITVNDMDKVSDRHISVVYVVGGMGKTVPLEGK